jgi:hypothetical protein
MGNCILCDYNRCVLSHEECGSGKLLKKAVRDNLRSSTVCLNEKSPRHGAHPRQNATCKFYAWDIKDRDKVLTRLVSKFRKEIYNRPPLEGDASKGYAPYYYH